jgi:hypothetical protein
MGSGRSNVVLEPYTSFDAFPTEYIQRKNRQQYGPRHHSVNFGQQQFYPPPQQQQQVRFVQPLPLPPQVAYVPIAAPVIPQRYIQQRRPIQMLPYQYQAMPMLQNQPKIYMPNY